VSALHAMALPENDPDSRAAAICRAHGRAVHHRTARGRAARDQAPRVQATRVQPPADSAARTQGPSSRVIRGRAPSGQAAPSQTAHDQTAHDQTAHGQAAPGQTERVQAARGPAARSQTARPRVARVQAARAQATDVPLRLTRRGRMVIGVAAAILAAGVSLIAAGAVQAADRSAAPRAAEQNLSRVVVRPGQSLWSVAERADPGADTRQVIQQIVELNGLTGDAVVAGQLLWVPRG
jgi:LysM domain